LAIGLIFTIFEILHTHVGRIGDQNGLLAVRRREFAEHQFKCPMGPLAVRVTYVHFVAATPSIVKLDRDDRSSPFPSKIAMLYIYGEVGVIGLLVAEGNVVPGATRVDHAQ
jgi:hypothetical protein